MLNMEFTITKLNQKCWELVIPTGIITMNSKDKIVCYLNRSYTHLSHKEMLTLVNTKLNNPASAISLTVDEIEFMRLKKVEKEYKKILNTVKNTKVRHFKKESEYDRIYISKTEQFPNWVVDAKKMIHILYNKKGLEHTHTFIQETDKDGIDKKVDKLFYKNYLNRIHFSKLLSDGGIQSPAPLESKCKSKPPKKLIKQFNLEIYIENINTAYSNVIEINPKKYDSDKLWKYESNELGTFKDLVIEDTLDKCILEKLIRDEKELKWTNTLELFIVKFKELQN